MEMFVILFRTGVSVVVFSGSCVRIYLYFLFGAAAAAPVAAIRLLSIPVI